MSTKRLLIISGVAFSLAGASVLGAWASGYFVVLVPEASLGIALGLMLLAFGSIAYLGVGKQPFRHRLAFFAGSVAALSVGLLPWVAPVTAHGFELRVKQTTESEWLRLAEDARNLVRNSSDDGQLPRAPGSDWNRGYVRKLADSHPVLRLGDHPPKLFVTEEAVGIYWGSGLIGTLAVDISLLPPDGQPAVDGLFRRKNVSDHVAIVWD